MGNWRNRPPRRFFYPQRAPNFPPTSSYHQLPPLSGICDDGVQPWEKKFCSLIGTIPWWKIVETKKLMHYESNILNWDDSAGENAFQNAKKRFWAEINGLPCDISLPDPDIYIDKIDWDPFIDPELIKDLEREHFAPTEIENEGKVGREDKKKKNSQSAPLEGCNQNSCSVDDPWQCNNSSEDTYLLENISQGWRPWDSDLNKLRNSDNDKNPWECSFAERNGAAKNATWGYYSDKAWGWNQGTDHVKHSRGWDNIDCHWGRSCNGNDSAKGNAWDNIGDKSWGFDRQEPQQLYSGHNPWGANFIPNTAAPRDGGWGDGGAKTWGWKTSGDYDAEKRKLELKRSGEGWGAWNSGSRKREGAYYRNPRFQLDNSQTGHSWRSVKANGRVSFAPRN